MKSLDAECALRHSRWLLMADFSSAYIISLHGITIFLPMFCMYLINIILDKEHFRCSWYLNYKKIVKFFMTATIFESVPTSGIQIVMMKN